MTAGKRIEPRLSTKVGMAWHRRRTGHDGFSVAPVTVPMFDSSPRGYLWKCSLCTKVWAE